MLQHSREACWPLSGCPCEQQSAPTIITINSITSTASTPEAISAISALKSVWMHMAGLSNHQPNNRVLSNWPLAPAAFTNSFYVIPQKNCDNVRPKPIKHAAAGVRACVRVCMFPYVHTSMCTHLCINHINQWYKYPSQSCENEEFMC